MRSVMISIEDRKLIKRFLVSILETINPRGISRSLSCKHPNEFNQILEFQKEFELKSLMEAIYCIINDIVKRPVCKIYSKRICLTDVIFKDINTGYREYCTKCYTLKNTEESMMKKYGVKNAACIPGIQEKKKENELIKSGGLRTSHNQRDEVKDKKSITLHEHYEGGMKNSIINERKIQTNINKRGVKWSTQTEETQNKRILTIKDKYGKDKTNVMHVDEVRQKVSNTWYKNNWNLNSVSLYIENKGFELVSDYINAMSNISLRCKKCNHIFNILWNSFQQNGAVCPKCFPIKSGRSNEENERRLI